MSKSLTELEQEIWDLKAEVEEKDGEILELQVENEHLAHRLESLALPEELYPTLADALLAAAKDVGRTALGPLNSVEVITEALEHRFITLIRV